MTTLSRGLDNILHSFRQHQTLNFERRIGTYAENIRDSRDRTDLFDDSDEQFSRQVEDAGLLFKLSGKNGHLVDPGALEVAQHLADEQEVDELFTPTGLEVIDFGHNEF